jgi:hypothetical protein
MKLRPSFGLRTLFAALTIFCLACGWLSSQWQIGEGCDPGDSQRRLSSSSATPAANHATPWTMAKTTTSQTKSLLRPIA